MSETKIITPKGMLSYPHLDKPQEPKDGKGNPKYSATIVFAPGTDLSGLEAAAVAAAEAKYPGKGKTMLAKNQLRSPFRRDAEAKGYAEGSVFVNVRTEKKPDAVYLHVGPDGKRPAIIAEEDIKEQLYPGALIRASLRAFAYDSNGNKGVSFALNNIQKLGDGERLDGRVVAEDDFDADLSATPATLEDVTS